jgi:hypothetical protein
MIPAGWRLEQRQDADFNGDGQNDVLALLRREGDSAPSERVLFAALATASRRGYSLHSANRQLVPTDPTGRIIDPMADGGIVVGPGEFELTLGMMPGAGSYQAATIRYRFRFEQDCFRLIGYDRAETHRGTLETRDVSVDFVTGVVVHKVGNAQSDATDERRESLSFNPRRCLPDLPSGWTFDPLAVPQPQAK